MGLYSPRILTFLDYYLPGYKAGGPLRTISNLVDQLGQRFDFRIVTRDRDAGDAHPYSGVIIDAWNEAGNAKVFYCSPKNLQLSAIRRLVKNAQPDLLYLNSYFSRLTLRVLVLRRLGLLPNVPLVLAPRGEFSPGAIQLKAGRKQAFIIASRWAGLIRGVFWQASSTLERQHIEQVVGRVPVIVAPNIPPQMKFTVEQPIGQREKTVGAVSLAFVSRISPKKNLLFALQILHKLHGQVEMDIYGHVSDSAYWSQCEQVIADLPANVRVSYCGALPNSEVVPTLAKYHFFLLPTLGENFGHAILEALYAGCPAIISDQTFWQNLASRQVGWDIPLDCVDRWQETLQQCVDMSDAEYQRRSHAAQRFAQEFATSPQIVQASNDLFLQALGWRQEQ